MICSKVPFQTALFGFMSGFCLLLSGNTLNFWLAESGVSLITLGLFTLVALPYSFKYFIALLTEGTPLSLRSWLGIAQVLILGTLLGLSQTPGVDHEKRIAFLTVLLALGAVIQDIYLDKLRIDKTQSTTTGPSAGGYTIGYRLGMLASGAGLIFLSHFVAWPMVFYGACIGLIGISLGIHWTISPTTSLNNFQSSKRIPLSLKSHILRPILKIAQGKRLVYVIVLISLYRLADNLIAVLANPFQLQLGFTAIEIAAAAKVFGITTAILGGFMGGKLIQKWGLSQSLYYFALIHLGTHSLFIIQSKIGYDLTFLYVVTGLENLTGSMAMVAYIAYMTNLCDQRYGTTQYALLSSIMGLSRTLLPASAGTLATYLPWETCFVVIMLLALPGVILSSPWMSQKF
jgi:MFS transporter, PAT family, beta-lactamase induction signal transducer AmpG